LYFHRIALNTRISKSSSSNFSISEFCEKFPEREPPEEEIHDETRETEWEEGQDEEIRRNPPPPFQGNKECEEASISPIIVEVKVPNEERAAERRIGIGGKGVGDLAMEMLPKSAPELPPPDGVDGVEGTDEESIPLSNKQPKCPPGLQTTWTSPRRRVRKVVHQDSPLIGGGSEGRRRILYDCKVRKDYPELFGISPRDRRSFIKSLGQKVRQSGHEEEDPLVTPYYYISPAPSPLPLQKQWRKPSALLHNPVTGPLTPVRGIGQSVEALRRGGREETPDSLPVNAARSLNLVEEERERSPEESSSNDSGISDDPVGSSIPFPLSGGASTGSGGRGFLRKSEVTTTSALTRVLETHQPETQGTLTLYQVSTS